MKNKVCCVKCGQTYLPECFPRAKSNATSDHECTLEEVPNDTGSELLIIQQLQKENHLRRCIVQQMDLLLEKISHLKASQQKPLKPAKKNTPQ